MLIVSCITGDVISTGQECFSTDTPFAWKLQGLELHNARPPFVKCIWATALVLFILIWLIRAGGNMNKGSPYIDLASLFFCHVFVFCLFISLPSFFFLFLSFPFFLFFSFFFLCLKGCLLTLNCFPSRPTTSVTSEWVPEARRKLSAAPTVCSESCHGRMGVGEEPDRADMVPPRSS